MTCDICGKDEATVHLTEIIDNKVTELHLCEGCAREKGAQMEQHFGLSDLLSGLADFGKQPADADTEVVEQIACANCGMSYVDFRKIGRFGCSECYESFVAHVTPLLKRIHGVAKHSGKHPHAAHKAAGRKRAPRSPSARSSKSTIRQLKEQLRRAIQNEAFEEAAAIRDQIRQLEQGAGT